MICPYRFVLEISAQDGRLLHQEAIRPDWEPALEAARLAGLRRFGVWLSSDDSRSVVEPIWAAAGQPRVGGVNVHLEHGAHAWSTGVVATQYFADAARGVVAASVADGRLQGSEGYHFSLSAYDAESDSPDDRRWRMAERPQPCPVRDRSFSGLVARCLLSGDRDPSDIDVVLPEDVLDEMCALALDAGECETGGVLLGHLCRNEVTGDVGLEITAQIPARHTEATATKVTFTSDTWTDVRAAVALRKADELLVGFWHLHPADVWCRACPVERQMVCQLGSGFLSADDKALHRAMFPAAYTQALLITRSVRGLETKAFGWRRGVLEPRAVLVSPADAARPRARNSLQLSPAAPSAAGEPVPSPGDQPCHDVCA